MKTFALLFTSALLCSTFFVAHAQDSGEVGGNRRVTAPIGYGGVRGTFSEPKFDHLNKGNDDKPQMYMGVRGNFEVDAGTSWVQKDTQSYYDTVKKKMVTTTVRNKWNPFIRVQGVYNGKQKSIYYNQHPVYVDKGRLVSVYEELFVIADHVHIQMNGFLPGGVTIEKNQKLPSQVNKGTQKKPEWVSVFTSKTAASMQSKRVIAMTQEVTKLDGSWLSGAKFSDGYVQPVTLLNKKFKEGGWVDWDSKGGASHYFPGGRWGEEPLSSAPKPKGDNSIPFVIDSGHTHGTGKTPEPSTMYSNETVAIHMYKTAHAQGKKAIYN